MGCSAAKSLNEYKATLPISKASIPKRDRRVSSTPVAKLENPAPPQPVKEADLEQQRTPIKGFRSKSKESIPLVSLNVQMSNTKLSSPIIIGKLEKPLAHPPTPLAPERKRSALKGLFQNFRLNLNSSEAGEPITPLLTL